MSHRSSSTKKYDDDDSGASTPMSSSHLSFESNGEPVVNPKKLHAEVSSILMGFSKAKKTKPIPDQESNEFGFMGEISEHENENENDESYNQSRSRTRLNLKYKTDSIVIDEVDKHVPFEV